MTQSSPDLSPPQSLQQPASSEATPFQQRRAREIKRQRILLLGGMLVIIAAWLYGYFTSGTNVTPYLNNVVPSATRFEQSGDVYVGYLDDNTQAQASIAGYAMRSSATGYSGPVDVLVGVDPAGNVIGVQILDYKETPGFFRLLPLNNFFDQFLNKRYTDPMQIGEDIDGVSGATLSAEAVALAIRHSVRGIANDQLHANLPPEKTPINFGIPEITLIALFAVGYFFHRSRNGKLKNWARWGSLLTGMVVLGFIYNKPFSLANVISFLSGYWPDWRLNLYWYLLLLGILFVVTSQGKNPYCTWFCPFSAVQETLSKVTGARQYRPKRLHKPLQWLVRGLAFTAIVLGLAFRNPGAASYEPFGTLFGFNGVWAQWALLAVVLLVSLLIYKPFCNYLCPLHPVTDGIGELRRWVREIWQIINPRHKNSNKVS